MSRAQRLLALLELLRVHRYPVRGEALARSLGVSVRTLYRDVAALRAQGARVEGAPGLGYVLRPGFTLPPLAFTEDEVEALALGARWVVERGDAALGEAARRALAKVRAVLPAERRAALDETGLLVPPRDVRRRAEDGAADVGGAAGGADAAHAIQATVRRAIRAERKLALTYRDQRGQASARTIWPVALAYFDRARVVVGWCELRAGFRHFRVDRIAALAPAAERYPRGRHVLLRERREVERVPARVTDGP